MRVTDLNTSSTSRTVDLDHVALLSERAFTFVPYAGCSDAKNAPHRDWLTGRNTGMCEQG